MAESALGFTFKSSSGVNEVFRMSKDGGFEKVETTNKDYPEVAPGEKLVIITGLTKPYEIDGRKKDETTGEIKTEKVTMIKVEMGVMDGRGKGNRFLMPFSFRVTKGTNLGKIIAAVLGDSFNPSGEWTPEMVMRKPFYLSTRNEQNGDFTNIRFVDARKYDEAVDGPISGAVQAAAPAPAQQASDDAIWTTAL